MIKDNLNFLKEKDIYSLILFSLYKIKEDPEYSSLSEMAYLLDKEDLLNLCEYYGGQIIKIPTIEELEDLISSLLLIQYTKVEQYSLEEALNKLKEMGVFLKNTKNFRDYYKKLLKILDEYEFKPRD